MSVFVPWLSARSQLFFRGVLEFIPPSNGIKTARALTPIRRRVFLLIHVAGIPAIATLCRNLFSPKLRNERPHLDAARTADGVPADRPVGAFGVVSHPEAESDRTRRPSQCHCDGLSSLLLRFKR